MILYGIPNCDSCRKARKWLAGNELEYRFHDLREDGIDRQMLIRWVTATTWEALLNTRSTTWRTLSENEKSDLDQTKAVSLMLAHPTLIKRPVLDSGGVIQVGFSDSAYKAFAANRSGP